IRRIDSIPGSVLRVVGPPGGRHGGARQIASRGDFRDRGRVAYSDDEPAVSQTDRAEVAAEPARGWAFTPVLGMDLGSVRIDSGHPTDGNGKDHLRLHRTAAGIGRVVGRLKSFRLQGFRGAKFLEFRGWSDFIALPRLPVLPLKRLTP